MGETVLVIAKKYKITPGDIYDYNPDAIQGLSAILCCAYRCTGS
jgi:hypothetical protein